MAQFQQLGAAGDAQIRLVRLEFLQAENAGGHGDHRHARGARGLISGVANGCRSTYGRVARPDRVSQMNSRVPYPWPFLPRVGLFPSSYAFSLPLRLESPPFLLRNTPSTSRAEGMTARAQEGVSRPYTAVKPAVLEVLRNQLQNPVTLRVRPEMGIKPG